MIRPGEWMEDEKERKRAHIRPPFARAQRCAPSLMLMNSTLNLTQAGRCRNLAPRTRAVCVETSSCHVPVPDFTSAATPGGRTNDHG